jgi:hypothetical protein
VSGSLRACLIARTLLTCVCAVHACASRQDLCTCRARRFTHIAHAPNCRYILKVQVGDKRWFKGVDKDAKVGPCGICCRASGSCCWLKQQIQIAQVAAMSVAVRRSRHSLSSFAHAASLARRVLNSGTSCLHADTRLSFTGCRVHGTRSRWPKRAPEMWAALPGRPHGGEASALRYPWGSCWLFTVQGVFPCCCCCTAGAMPVGRHHSA